MKRHTRRTILIAAAAVLLIGVASAAVVSFRSRNNPSMIEKDAAEATTLLSSNGLVWRDGDSLNLRTKSGAVLTLTDRVTCGDVPCPTGIVVRYRYNGWSESSGGYRLRIIPSVPDEMLLPFADDTPVLLDEHSAPTGPKMALPAVPGPSSGPDETLSEWQSDVAEGREQNEKPLIAQSNGKVSRDAARLSLSLENGKKLVLTDDLACGELACPSRLFRVFDYSGASPDGRYWVVKQRWDEADAALLIDSRSGAVTPLLSEPHFSSDGKRRRRSVTDLEWTAPRRLEIWSLAGDVPVLEFSLSARDEDDTVYEVVGWPDSSHVRLRRGSWSTDQRTEAMLVFDSGAWRLQGD